MAQLKENRSKLRGFGIPTAACSQPGRCLDPVARVVWYTSICSHPIFYFLSCEVEAGGFTGAVLFEFVDGGVIGVVGVGDDSNLVEIFFHASSIV